MKDLNITIVNWNARDDIDRCLCSLKKDLEGSGIDAVVHIVDNSQNNDNIKGLIENKYGWAKYIDAGDNIGFGKAQKLGAQVQETRYYLSLNPDVWFMEGGDTIRSLMDFLEVNKKAGIVAPKILNSDDTVQLSCYRFFSFWDPIIRRLDRTKSEKAKKRVNRYLMNDFAHNETVRTDWVMGSFMLIKKEMMDEVGYFDDRFFMYFEDTDLCRRAWRGGWEVWYVHSCRIYHAHHRDSLGTSALRSILTNRMTRVHISSWLKYFFKWGFKKEHFGI